MNQKFSLFLVISLLAVQVLAFLHMVEFNFDEHEHDGQTCQIHLYCDHTTYDTAKAANVLQQMQYFVVAVSLPKILPTHFAVPGAASPRAPPVFSL